MGLSKAHTHATTTVECSRRVELGLDRNARLKTWQLRFLGLGALGRCALRRVPLAAHHAGNGVEGERVLAPAGQHVRGSESSEGVSTFRIVLQKSFDDAVAQRSCLPAKACAR